MEFACVTPDPVDATDVLWAMVEVASEGRDAREGGVLVARREEESSSDKDVEEILGDEEVTETTVDVAEVLGPVETTEEVELEETLGTGDLVVDEPMDDFEGTVEVEEKVAVGELDPIPGLISVLFRCQVHLQ
ncbi:hypothetical protein PHLCEN_2v813 [Hermanssonia centrifuga]|uniref:Uncharacterized protein n=1 Tax=Hermanssonia centrifuga TaxID=98765 RepID=A0A2R6S4Z0_9APHY|nr:hypothetical protein PHLCEN_2v813 [Hermanssonia centrifuga]